MTVTITYYSNKIGLASLLVNLQPQLDENDHIYVVDTSPDKSGLEIVKMYGSNRAVVMCETSNPCGIYKAWNFGIQSMMENKQEGILILNDDVLLSTTFIANLKKAHKLSRHLALVPATPSRNWVSQKLDPNFKWYSKAIQKADIATTKWLRGFVFYLKRECVEQYGNFNEKYMVWCGDTEYENRIRGKIGIFKNEYVYHFGGKSFNYMSDETKKKIEADIKLYKEMTGNDILR